jgi:hypothetical protein
MFEDFLTNTNRLSRRSFIKVYGSSALLAGNELVTHAGKAYPENTKRMIRMGVVGGGFGASFYWHEHPNCQVTAVTDLRVDRRERLTKVYQCDKV